MKKVNVFTGVMCAVLLSGCGLSQPNPADGPLVYPPTTWPVPTSSRSAIALEPVHMKTFTSAVLGFSFHYPDTILVYEGECGKRSSQVPSVIFEDTKRQKIFLAPAIVADAPVDNPDCQNRENTIPLIEESPDFDEWDITILSNVKTEDALLSAIRDMYGPECFLDEKTIDEQTGYSHYRVRPPNVEGLLPGDPRCPVHSAIQVIFASQLGRAAYWDLGQEAKFWKDEAATESYDMEMIDSVRFQ